MDTRFRCILLLAGMGLLCIIMWIGKIPEATEQVVFLAAILLTGIPHGAMDHLVESSDPGTGASFRLDSFILHYLSPVLAFGIIWLINPWYALVGFLIISGKHFSETDLLPSRQHGEPATAWEQFIFGIIIIGSLLVPHADEVMKILVHMPYSTKVLKELWPLITPLSQILLSIALLWAGYVALRVIRGRKHPLILLQAIVLPVLLHKLPLLTAFTFYFGVWHSLISIRNIYVVLRQETGVTPFELVRKAIPFSVIAMVGIALLVYCANLSNQLSSVSLGIFIGISIITIPHTHIMSQLFARLSGKKDGGNIRLHP